MGTVAWLVQYHEDSLWKIEHTEPEQWQYFQCKRIVYFEVA